LGKFMTVETLPACRSVVGKRGNYSIAAVDLRDPAADRDALYSLQGFERFHPFLVAQRGSDRLRNRADAGSGRMNFR
jgi:hypothetical protein